MNSYFLRYNERIKGISGVLNNLGTGLLAVSVGRMSLSEADVIAVLWFAGAIVLLFAGWVVLGLLEEV